MDSGFGTRLGDRLDAGDTVAFIGVYDVLSASLAAQHFDGLLVSSSAFAASHYGVPDVGFIAWSDVSMFVRRLRALHPATHIIVDIDNGSCDTDVACHAVALLESAGASGVILGDQDRRTRASELDQRRLLDPEVFRNRLIRVLHTRRDLFVVARTSAVDADDVSRRTAAFAEAGAHAVLADRASGLSQISAIRVATGCRVAVNQHAESGAPLFSLGELRQAGISLAVYGSACFEVAERAIKEAMESLHAGDGMFAEVCHSMCGSRRTAPVTPSGAEEKRSRQAYPWTAPAHISAL